jgi:outer membrane protein assembly factor BamB
MSSQKNTSGRALHKPLRLWPGIVIVLLQWLIRFGLPLIAPETLNIAVMAGAGFWILLLVWWAFFSRAPGIERWGAIVLMAAALYLTSRFIDVSIATGAQGFMFLLFSIPVLSLAFVTWAVVTRSLSVKLRQVTLVATIVAATGAWLLVRNDGITGDFHLMLAWRWSETPEERALEQNSYAQVLTASASAVPDMEAVWPGFRGPERDNVIHGLRIDTDWEKHPPEELWRTPVGPGCSSCAVSGSFIFTQEQRGEDEAVACYSLETGKLVWLYQYPARFWDSHAGAGPRATPAIRGDFVCTHGGTGVLNMLDARNGSLIWSRNTLTDTGNAHSGWGISSSPVFADSLVIVAAVGQLAAYDMRSGELRWIGPQGGDSYSSPHLLTIDGIQQVLLMSAQGLTSVAPADGSQLWKYSWPGDSRIVQPAIMDDGDFLVGRSDGSALRRISIHHRKDAWSFNDKWTSLQIRPNFNDFVVHKGYAYGYNGSQLVCIDLETGERSWRGGRYGGQVLLLADQDLLLVLGETGNVALVGTGPEEFREVADFDAIEGKTWNHPTVAGDILLVRNTEEMAAFRMIRTNI